MTNAELRTLRESLALSIDEAAAMAGVEPAVVAAWESPSALARPQAVAARDRLVEKLIELDEMLWDWADAVVDMAIQASMESIVLERYPDTASLHAAEPHCVELGLSANTHAVALFRSRYLLEQAGIGSAIDFAHGPD